jgi:hypothetical protein
MQCSAKNITYQFRSLLLFDIVNVMHVLATVLQRLVVGYESVAKVQREVERPVV